MITIKLDIQTDQVDRIKQYQKQYSNLLHIYYNRIKDGLNRLDCSHITNLNNVQLILNNSWLKYCCIDEAISLNKRNQNKKVIFGGKLNYFNRLKGLITREQYQQNKLSPIYSIGEAKQYGCNRKFYIQSIDTIVFKPNRKQHIELKIKVSKKYQQFLKILILHQQQKDISITYKLSYKHIWISFDQKILKQKYKQYKKIENRIISIDMNPNYIGYSIIDWKSSQQFKLIDKGVLSIKLLNDYDNSLKLQSSNFKKKYITNKRNYEVLQCSKFLIQKMKHYRCSIFAIEDLNIKRKDVGKGKRLNKLINNNWCRTRFVNNLTKWCNVYNVELLKIAPAYSSFIGNIVYRSLKLPDMILSSIQISRRGFEFYHQYIAKDKQSIKNIIQPIISHNVRSKVTQSLEELSIQNIIWNDLIELYYIIKKSKCKYRFPLQIKEFFRLNQLRYVNIVTFLL